MTTTTTTKKPTKKQMYSAIIAKYPLTEDEKAQLDEYLEEDPPTPDFNIPGNEIFKYLFNKDTCRRVLEELMQWGYRVDGGETLGKTIIFAKKVGRNIMVSLLEKLFTQYRKLGIDNQIDYDKFYLYSLITHSTAI